jgi:hypothetical protein
MSKSLYLQGYLLGTGGEELTRENSLRSSQIYFTRQLEGTKWEEYRFSSPKPLMGEEQLTLTGSFDYIILARRSASRILVAGEGLRIVEQIIRFENSMGAGPKLRRVTISVHALVQAIAQTPGRYLLSRVDALVPGYGQALRSISFYGDDVGEAALFRTNLEVMQCYGCGLREVASLKETLRLVNKGVVSFQFNGPRSIIGVERALHFVSSQELLKFI